MLEPEALEPVPRFLIDLGGMCAGANWVASPHCDARPDGVDISLLVIHAISLPPGQFGGPWIADLFLNRLDPGAHPYFADIASLRVSAHFLIGRDGVLTQFVPCELRAWHAGVSSWNGRERCNDFSIGIELEGTDDAPFEEAQYDTLIALTGAIFARYGTLALAGHSEVAPGRKTDPGPGFDWGRLRAALSVI